MPKISRRVALALAAAAATTASARAMTPKPHGESNMERVTGIGGFFFRAKDPTALAKWYEDNLGVNIVPEDYDTLPWRTEAGTTVFAPFKADTDYFGDPAQQWMINFRVRDLDAMAAQLRAGGSEVEVDPEGRKQGCWPGIIPKYVSFIPPDVWSISELEIGEDIV
jgi:hypothetical protein